MMNQSQWIAIRTSSGTPTLVGADSAGTLLSNANNNLHWDAHPAGRYVEVPFGYDALLVSLIGSHASAAENKTATVLLYGAWERGPAKYIGQFAFTIGAQKVQDLPYPPFQDNPQGAQVLWADTLTITSSELWPTDPVAFDSGNDRIVLADIRTYGIKRILADVSAVSAGLTVMPVFIPVTTL